MWVAPATSKVFDVNERFQNLHTHTRTTFTVNFSQTRGQHHLRPTSAPGSPLHPVHVTFVAVELEVAATGERVRARDCMTSAMAAAAEPRTLAKLRIQQFYKADPHNSRTRLLTRKELMDEVNSLTVSSAHFGWSRSPGQRNAKVDHNVLRPRDVRKVDPTFATRLEPAILVRAGVIILSLGRIMALVTRESLYCVMCDGQDEIVRKIQSSLLTLIAAAEREAVMASDMDLQAAAELSATPGRLRRSNSDPRLSSSEVQQQPNHLHTPMAKGAASASNGISLQFGGLLNGGPGGVCFEFCGLVCVQPTAMLRASLSLALSLPTRQPSLSPTPCSCLDTAEAIFACFWTVFSPSLSLSSLPPSLSLLSSLFIPTLFLPPAVALVPLRNALRRRLCS